MKNEKVSKFVLQGVKDLEKTEKEIFIEKTEKFLTFARIEANKNINNIQSAISAKLALISYKEQEIELQEAEIEKVRFTKASNYVKYCRNLEESKQLKDKLINFTSDEDDKKGLAQLKFEIEYLKTQLELHKENLVTFNSEE